MCEAQPLLSYAWTTDPNRSTLNPATHRLDTACLSAAPPKGCGVRSRARAGLAYAFQSRHGPKYAHIAFRKR